MRENTADVGSGGDATVSTLALMRPFRPGGYRDYVGCSKGDRAPSGS